LAHHLQHPDTRDKAAAGRLAASLNTRLLEGVTRDEVLLLRAYLLRSVVSAGYDHWWREKPDAWTKQIRSVSLERALRLGGLEQDADHDAPAVLRGRLLADVLRYRMIAWRTQSRWISRGYGDDDETLIADVPITLNYVTDIAHVPDPELMMLAVGPLELKQREALWWCGWLDWNAPADRLQQGPAPDAELVGGFLKHSCRRSKASRTQFADLYHAYREWAQPQWLLALDPQPFCELIELAGYPRTGDTPNDQGFEGLRLRSKEDMQPVPGPPRPRPGP